MTGPLRVLYRSITAFGLLSALAVSAFVGIVLPGTERTEAASMLAAGASALSPVVHALTPQASADALRAAAASTGRSYELIEASGALIAGSGGGADAPDVLKYRPEVAAAFDGGTGVNVRPDDSGTDRMYVALPVSPVRSGGSDTATDVVLRVSAPLKQIPLPFVGFVRELLAIVAALFLAGVAATGVITSRYDRSLRVIIEASRRFASGAFDERIPAAHVAKTAPGLAGIAHLLNRAMETALERIAGVERERARVEAILSAMVEGVILLDAELRVRTMNRSASALFDRSPQPPGGRTLVESLRNTELLDVAEQALKSRATVERIVSIYGRSVRQLQVHATALRGVTGISEGVLIVLSDITRLKHLEELRKEFVSNVSHELRTPVTTIKGFVETLLDDASAAPDDAPADDKDDKDDAPARTKRFLQIILNHTNRIHLIIEDLLSLSRLEQQDSPLRFESVELRALVDAALESCRERAAEKDITVRVTHEGAGRASCSPRLLEQAVTNLVDNAIKYSGPGTHVEIRVRNYPGLLTVAVKDEGIGIPSADLPRIFERFFRVDRARSRDIGGTGLGLAIVKHIALAHGGEVLVDSRVGEGSVFTMYLPQRIASDARNGGLAVDDHDEGGERSRPVIS